MGTTTIRLKGEKFRPESETQFRRQQALEHRRRGFPGDEAAAKTHELEIQSIREGRVDGDSRVLAFCPPCLKKGSHVLLLEIGEHLRCGTCRFERGKRT